MPQISVIVPVYKVEPYLRRCVDSILGQTFADFELILVDDGSPDQCGAICDEYAQKDPRVVVIHQENGGLSTARNAGIDWAFANSNSQWLSFIDSDDWVHPEYLQRLLDAALTTGVSVSICGYAQTNGEELEIKPDDLAPVLWNTEDYFVKHNVNATVAWGKLYRKECFAEIRYPVGKLHEDEFTTYKILFCYEQVAVISEALYAYYQNEQGIMRSKWNPKRMDILYAYLDQIDFFSTQNRYCVLRSVLTRYMWRVDLIQKRIDDLKQPHLVCRYRFLLRFQRRRTLIRYHRYLPLQEYPWIYEMVFPFYMRFYWIFVAAARKIQK